MVQRVDFDRMAEALRNWGRWGTADQRGTLNHIGPSALHRAAASVRSGKAFALGLAVGKDGPQNGTSLGRFNPQHYVTAIAASMNPDHPTARASDDVISMPLQAGTQWDALAHVHYDGTLYNGHKACDTLSEHGASCLGIEHLAHPGIASRGVLLDVARLKGVERLPTATAITIADLEECRLRQGVTLEAGDIVLVRTGHIRHFTVDNDRDRFNAMQPGLHHECAEWLHRHELAAVAADNVAVEVINADMVRGEMAAPLHMLCLRDMGMPLGEMFDMEALAADCAVDGQYDFFLSAPPLAVTGGFGSPVNPMAVK